MPDKHVAPFVDAQTSPLYVRIISGSIGSIVTALVVTPLDVAKVALQGTATPSLTSLSSANTRFRPRGCGTFVLYNGELECLLPRSAVPFCDQQTGALTERARLAFSSGTATSELGTLAVLRRIYSADGLSGIYAGLRPTLVMAAPNTIIYFSAYEDLSWRLRRASQDGSQTWIPLVSGSGARLLASSVTAPFEYLRTRHASMVGTSQPVEGMWSEMRTIVQKEGLGTLYRGFRSTLWRDVPFSAIYWVSIEQLRALWRERSPSPPTPMKQAMEAFVNGAISGLIAAACTTPFDVVKTRQQAAVQAVEEATTQQQVATFCCHNGADCIKPPAMDQGSARPLTIFQHLEQIARTEGVRGLWRGNLARMLKVAPACAIMISSYEFGKRILE